MYLSERAEKISYKLNLYGIEHRYKYYPLYENGFPISEKVFKNIIDLPSNYYLTDDQIKSICTIIKRVEDE
jgi:dTDP-4-amino-4,6-dideoxygalactose transaminase